MSGDSRFIFNGIIPASKSLMNRALICSSFSEQLTLLGNSSCDDVQKMAYAISQIQSDPSPNASYDCGAAGTVLRFLSIRLSRIPGRHILKGTKRLMQRSHADLLSLLDQLQVKVELREDCMIIDSKGWVIPQHPILVSRGISSQFMSGLLLSSWDLPCELKIKSTGLPLSEGYLSMTIKVLNELGMKIDFVLDPDDGTQIYVVSKNSKIQNKTYRVESDLSSMFAVAAFAALNGEAQFREFPLPSLQPDSEFLSILEKMKIKTELSAQGNSHVLKVTKTTDFVGINADLQSCPDLFPVLATLCAFAKSPSHLFGAPHLIHKESDRVAKISELLGHIGVTHESLPDGMKIYPSLGMTNNEPFQFDTDDDHRIAFAASLVKSQGFPIEILNPTVVSKSFPEFWKIVGLNHEV